MNNTENPNVLCGKLDRALQYGTTADVLKLFDEGMDPNQTDYEGRTALQFMALRGEKAAVETLLEKGADVNFVFMYHGRIQLTALDAAEEGNWSEIAGILIERGGKRGRELRQ